MLPKNIFICKQTNNFFNFNFNKSKIHKYKNLILLIQLTRCFRQEPTILFYSMCYTQNIVSIISSKWNFFELPKKNNVRITGPTQLKIAFFFFLVKGKIKTCYLELVIATQTTSFRHRSRNVD